MPRVWFMLGEKRGRLIVRSVQGDIYNCECECGRPVRRTYSQMFIRKMLTCETCHAEYVADKISEKKQERDKKRAYDSAAHPRW